MLRLPYQLQLAPIFLWGFFLGGGTFRTHAEIGRFLAVFLIFHIGAFGGMTALNSFYDRDGTPVGGMWAPPKVPAGLWHFAWIVQLGALILLLPFGAKLCFLYISLLVLSLLYSHPLPRGKGHPAKGLVIVTLGQGVLDCLAGAVTALQPHSDAPFRWGMIGATLTVAAFYPLTQLYQIAEDRQHGDRTLAAWLVEHGGRTAVFRWSFAWSTLGTLCNALALWEFGLRYDAAILCVSGTIPLFFIVLWQSSTRNASANSARADFGRVHLLMRVMALAFGCYLLARLSYSRFS